MYDASNRRNCTINFIWKHTAIQFTNKSNMQFLGMFINQCALCKDIICQSSHSTALKASGKKKTKNRVTCCGKRAQPKLS